MSVLLGALDPADVVDVPDDAAGLRAAARQFVAAVDGVHDAATSGAGTWSGLPTVLRADALTPALQPLMDPALRSARDLRRAADEFLRVAGGAADDIERLHGAHDDLVRQIEHFRSSAPGRVEAQAAADAATGDLIGAVATVVTHWQQVPALVAEDGALRLRVRAHNEDVTTTLARIAGQLDGVAPAPAEGTVHLASATTHGDGNWFTHAWHDVEDTAKVAWTGIEVGAEAAWPYIQDGAATAGNVFASLGNAMVQHPDEVLTLLGGLAIMAGGSAMEGGGVALDITGIGAVIGVPLNVSGAAVIAAGGTMAAAGALPLGVHAMTDDSATPYDTDHVARARNEPNERYPGRNKAGEYQSKDNDKARTDSAQKEAQGLKQYSKQNGGVHVDDTKVLAKQPGVEKGRFYDGLVKKPDGTYEGIEVKSGSSKDAAQEAFDAGVSYDEPAYATLNGERIEITSVDYQYVK